MDLAEGVSAKGPDHQNRIAASGRLKGLLILAAMCAKVK